MDLYRKFFNTPVADAVNMTNYSDEDILYNSSGVVNKTGYSYDEDEYGNVVERTDSKNSPLDTDIFGPLNKDTLQDSTNMAHVPLPVAVLNINYLYGTMPVLPGILKISRSDIEKVVYYTSYLITESGNSDYPAGTVINEAELNSFSEDVFESISYKTGAEAIEDLMKNRGIKNTGVVLHNIPVLPYAFRFNATKCPEHGDVLKESGVSYPLTRVINRVNRLDKLLNMSAPDIIIRNEKRILQEYIDSYINNGARGCTALNTWGKPTESLQDYAVIFNNTGGKNKKWDISLFKTADTGKIFDIAKEISELYPVSSEEWFELTEEEALKEEEYYDEICRMNSPLLSDIIKDRYPSLSDFHDVILSEGFRSLRAAVEGYIYRTYHDGYDDHKNDKNELISDFFSGVIPAMNLRVRNLMFA